LDNATRETVQRWLMLAEEDVQLAKSAIRTKRFTRPVCFHAEQCVEKSLKGFLAAKGKEPERTHDLVRLLHICAHEDLRFLKYLPIVETLTIYSVSPRYPDDWREIPLQEAREAINAAKKLFKFIKESLALSDSAPHNNNKE